MRDTGCEICIFKKIKMEGKKPIVRKMDWIFVLIGILVIGYILFDQGGCKTIHKTEKLEWVE